MKKRSEPRRPLPGIVNPRKVRSARHGLPDQGVLVEAAEVFRLLANPVRLALMHAVTHDELTVGDLARALGLSLSATSHQLALLRRMRLVAARDEGRLTHYRATDAFVSHLVHDCLAHVGDMHDVMDEAPAAARRAARRRGRRPG
jgi:DNA-binding transcriptional ArsR family regulator